MYTLCRISYIRMSAPYAFYIYCFSMEITRNNFDSTFLHLEEACDKATFISIDLEFTGLGCKNDNFTLFDSSQQRYAKLSHTVKSFIPCQLGIACFCRNMQENTFTVVPFNIYLFPSDFCNDRVFCSSSSALSFLSRNGFSFDKGVQFMNSDEMQIVKNDLLSGLAVKNDMNETLLSDLSRLVDLWKDNVEQSIRLPLVEQGVGRMIFMYELSRRHPLLVIEDDENDPEKIKVTRKSDPSDLDAEWKKSQERIFRGVTAGFKIFECISKKKVPLVGHNLEFDLMFLYQNLYRNLPDEISDFKAELHACFPAIYDTKILANGSKQELEAAGVKRFRLDQLYQAFENPKVLKNFSAAMPGVVFDRESRYEGSTDFYHEAGFDAYVTGRVFITLLHISALKLRPKRERNTPLTMGKYLKAVKTLCNRVYVGRGGIPYINLQGLDPNRGRNANILKLDPDVPVHQLNSHLNGFRPYDIKKVKSETFVATNSQDKVDEAVRKLNESGVNTELCPQDMEQRKKNIVVGLSLAVLVLSVVLSWGLTFVQHNF